VSATIVEQQRTLPYDPAALCKLVGDVRTYPRFIPWLKSIRVTQETLRGDGWEGIAEAVVGWRAITEKFATKVRSSPETGEVDVELVRGPFRTLRNRWRFTPTPGGAHVKFWIAYEIKNPVLNAIVSANRELVATRILKAFIDEAERRLGPPAPSASA
jgi:coenzyme Q-binding protein COQ10